MASRRVLSGMSKRCPQCKINYPAGFSFPCRVCEGSLLRSTMHEPDVDWVDKVASMREYGTPRESRSDEQATEAYRQSEFVRLSFEADVAISLTDAARLARARHVDVHRFADLLKAGASPDQAARILL